MEKRAITLQELHNFLNRLDTQFEYRTRFITKYLSQESICVDIINKLIDYMTATKGFTTFSLNKVYANEIRKILLGTKTVPTEQALRNILPIVMLQVNLVPLAVEGFKRGKRAVASEVIETLEIKNKNRTREHMARMREAKLRKKEERENGSK